MLVRHDEGMQQQFQGSKTMGRLLGGQQQQLRQQLQQHQQLQLQQQFQQQQQQQAEGIPLQFVGGSNTLRFGENSLLGRLTQEHQNSLHVTTVNGNQFVCLNINQEQPDQTTATYVTSASDTYVPYNGARHSAMPLPPVPRPGQIQAPVHSQSVMSSSLSAAAAAGTMPRARAQFAHAISEK
jgi:hypothetical protein